MPEDPDLLEVGRIRRPHGLAGEVVVQLFTNRSERLDEGARFDLEDRVLVVRSARPSRDRWLVRFIGVEGREAAEALRGAVLRAGPLEDDEAMWVHQLIGLRVRDAVADRGVITAIQANPASDLLVLDTGHLVPARFVASIDDEVVTVDVPAGLFEL